MKKEFSVYLQDKLKGCLVDGLVSVDGTQAEIIPNGTPRRFHTPDLDNASVGMR